MRRVSGDVNVPAVNVPGPTGQRVDGGPAPPPPAYLPAVQVAAGGPAAGGGGGGKGVVLAMNGGNGSTRAAAAGGAAAAAAAAAGATTKGPEPGWMRFVPFLPRRHLVPWIPCVLRLIQICTTLVSFAVVASMNHPNTLCHNMLHRAAEAATNDPSSATASLAVLVDNALCLPGRNYKDFVALEFFVVITATTFAWSCLIFALDMVGAGNMHLFRVIKTEHGLEWAARRGAPRVALVGDVVLTLLCFAASCAVAGLRTGLDDLSASYCAGVGRGWCDRMTTAVAFGYLSFIAMVPSAVLNTANSSGPW